MHPVLLKLGPFTIYAFGATLLTAMALGFAVVVLAALRFRAPMYKVLATSFPAFGVFVVAAIIGNEIAKEGSFNPRAAGFLLLPGVVTAMVAAIAIALIVRGPVGAILDAVGVGAIAGFGLGRVGCFLAGCCAGTPTTLPWGVRFPATTTVIPEAIRGLALHPTQLYIAVVLMGAAALLLVFGPRLSPGRAGSLALATFAVSSLATSPIRCDPPSLEGIVTSIVLLIVAAVGAVVSGRKQTALS